MGDVDSDGWAGRRVHVHGPGPYPYQTTIDTSQPADTLREHWGAKGIEKSTALTDTQPAALKTAANTSQAAFDSTAAGIATWYNTFADDAGLTPAEEADCKKRMRRAWAQT